MRRTGSAGSQSRFVSSQLWDPAELGARLAADGIEVLIIEADFAFEELFSAAPGLRLVGVCRNALNQVDLDSATAHGVAVVHAPGRNTNAVAEMTLALMLTLSRGLIPAHTLISGGGWRDPALGYRTFRGREIAGSTVGVVGFGQIGRSVTEKCRALGAGVIVHDPLVPERVIGAAGAGPTALHELAATADFVSVHVPAAESTRGLIGEEFITAMRPQSYLINTSAGAVVDTAALVAALEQRAIAGAALDVFEGQPLPASSPLMTAPNLILTPHIGGATSQTVERHSRMMVEAIERMIDDEPLPHLANPDYRALRAR